MRPQIIKHYLSYSAFSEDDIETIHRRLSVAIMRQRFGMSIGECIDIQQDMILDAECEGGVYCSKNNNWDDCFLYEEFDETLYLYYNIGKDTKTITKKIL